MQASYSSVVAGSNYRLICVRDVQKPSRNDENTAMDEYSDSFVHFRM